MSRSRLMSHIAHEYLFVSKAGSTLLCRRNHSSAVVAHIDDECPARCEVNEYLVEIAVAGFRLEGTDIHIAHVVVEGTIAQGARNLVVGAEIASLQGVAEVLGIVFVPSPVASHIEGCIEVHMTVAQLGEHSRQQVEELLT